MRKNIIILLMILGFVTVQSQNYKFGKVSVEELKAKSSKLDSSANAEVLYKDYKVNYIYNEGKGFVKTTSIHERIKIYNKEGFSWATKKIKLYDKINAEREDVDGFKGYTFTLSKGGEVVKTKLKSSAVLREKINKFWRQEIVTFPNIEKGCVIEYKYDIVSPFIAIDDIYVQEVIPINKVNIIVNIPEYFIFKKHINPRASYMPKTDESSTVKSFVLNSKNRVANNNNGLPTSFSSNKTEYKERIISISNEGIPPVKKEPYLDYLDNYRAKLILEYVAFKNPSGRVENFATDWESIVKSIYDSETFGGQLKKQNYFKEDIDNIIKESTNENYLITSILEFVKSKVKWDEFIGVSTNKGVKKAYTQGSGNVAEINLMLTSMLRYAGINANPVLISTKYNGVPLYPTRKGFNYVVCGVELKGEVVLLDATQPFGFINDLPENALNWQGRMIREHGSSAWVSLYPKKNSINTTMIFGELDNDLIFTGKARVQKTNYVAFNYRNNFAGIDKEDLTKFLAKGKGEIEMTDITVENEKNLAKPILMSYNFEYEDGIEEIGKDIYIDPLLFLTERENVFNAETRTYPIDFNYPFTDKKVVNLKVPEDYRVKSFPKSEKVIMAENLGEYSYLVRANGNSIQISQSFKVNFPIIPAAYYDGLKGAYEKMISKNSEKIVLEKI